MTANLAELLSRAAAAAPERVALVELPAGLEMTWAELDDGVSSVARGLEQQGAVAGNRVLLAMPGRTELVVAYLAALRARLVAVPVDPRAAIGDLLRIVAHCTPRLVVCDASTVDQVRAVVAGLADADGQHAPPPRPVVVGALPGDGEVAWAELARADAADVPLGRDPEALAALLYTWDATGRPCGAMLTHRALLAGLEQVAAVDPPVVASHDVVGAALTPFHGYGLTAVLGQVLLQAARLVLVETDAPADALDDLRRSGATVVVASPAVLGQWSEETDLGARLGGVRLLLSGAAPLPAQVVADLRDWHGLRVHRGYVLTEAGPLVTSTLCSDDPDDASLGAPLPGVSLRVLDDDGRPAAPGDPGEIRVCGDNLFDGCWPDGTHGPVEGWYATGDVGYLDGSGDLFLVDRLEEVMVVSGFTVYPSEVEEVVTAVPGVLEAAVVGERDEEAGELVVAYVRPVPDTGLAEEELRARIVDACQQLARFKRPARVLLVDRLPHTPGGRVAHGTLRNALHRARRGTG